MLKSTAIKIAQNDSMIRAERHTAAAIEEHNTIYREDVEERKRHNKYEEETKDRIDVSKKEYLELLEDRKELARKKEAFHKMFSCLYKARIPEGVIHDIMDGKFDFKVVVMQKPVDLKSTVTLSFDVDFFDYRY